MSTDYVDLVDLAAFLGVEVEDLREADAQLALDAAQSVVRRYLDQEITLVEDDEIELDGTGKDSLVLPQLPVREVATVTEDGAEVDVEEELLLRNGILYKRDCSTWRIGRGNVAVTYDHGWDPPADSGSSGPDDLLEVPADIRLVTLSIARRLYSGTATTSTGGAVTGETMGSYSYQLADPVDVANSLLTVEKATLARYRVGGVA